MGFEQKWVDHFVSLRLRFVGGQLLVAEEYSENPHLPQMLLAAFLKLWKFTAFSDGRFCCRNDTSRALVAAGLGGLSSLVQHVRQI